jgi:Domain of unknown function (DUF4917)
MTAPVQEFTRMMQDLAAKKRRVSLLLGNGFSMAYDPVIFSYNSLYEFLQSGNDEDLKILFSTVNTRNFELVMDQVQVAVKLIDVFGGSPELSGQIGEAASRLKSGLITAIEKLHPDFVFSLSVERSQCCARFLKPFVESKGHIFTTNYDLLLYWVLMSQGVRPCIDGFGRDTLNEDEVKRGEDPIVSELYWGPNRKEQNVHYLHGALHLFDSGATVEKEQYDPGTVIMTKIRKRMNRQSYPIFVAAGSAEEKLDHIRHNSYLSNCYDRIADLEGSVVTYGFSFGASDDHIIEALNRAAKKAPDVRLWSVYIGCYSDKDVEYIKSIEYKFKVPIRIYKSNEVNPWC